MAPKLNWQKASREAKVLRQGSTPHEDLLPRTPFGYKVSKRDGLVVKKSTMASKQKAKTNTTISKRADPNRGANHLLHFVADSILAESWISAKVPKTVGRDLADRVECAGGLRKWAEAQPGFQNLLEKKRKRRAAKASAKGKSAGSTPHKQPNPTAPRDRDSRLKEITHLKSEIAQAEEFIRVARKKIAELEQS